VPVKDYIISDKSRSRNLRDKLRATTQVKVKWL